MKAIVNTIYGGPDVLMIKEVPKPVPKQNEILIKVRAATVNRTDCGFLRGKPLIVRFFSGFGKPKNPVLGNEFAGDVEAVGNDVRLFKTGDKVFGYNEDSFGAHAEYMVLPESGNVATLPANMNYEEAVPILEGGHYAWSDIQAAKITAGQEVLVNGATGAIGSAAVQLLKYLGAEVTAVCGTEGIDVVRSLNPDAIVDYMKEDFTKLDKKFDVVFDAVGKSSFLKCRPLLKKEGIYMSTELGYKYQNIFWALFTPLFRGRKLLFPIPAINKDDVLFFKQIAESGRYRPIIDRCYKLEQIPEAYRYVESGKKIGNVVINISE